VKYEERSKGYLLKFSNSCSFIFPNMYDETDDFVFVGN